MVIDPYFFDNNSLIGYCFEYDPQYDYAQDVFNRKCTHHWSTNVEFEFNDIYQHKQNKMTELITNIVEKLRNSEGDKSLNFLLSQAHSIIIEDLDNSSRKNIIKKIWIEAEFNKEESIEKIILTLNKFEGIFYSRSGKNRAYCLKRLREPHQRKVYYPECERLLSLDGLDDLERIGGDMNICLDAHDLAKNLAKKMPKNRPHEFTMITDDKGFFSQKDIIEEQTDIDKVACLRDF